jgi:hypothetical protein
MHMSAPEFDSATERLSPNEADPILAHASMPLQSVYFPLGFPLSFATNSLSLHAAAFQSWGKFRQVFSTPPLTLRIGVTYEKSRSALLPGAPVCRLQGHLLSNIADPDNFVVCDLNDGYSFGWLTPQTAENVPYSRYHILEAGALAMVAALRAAPLHAACVTAASRGMLLCGDSGAGKTSLALAAARAGWTFTSDDACYLPIGRSDRMVVGNCHQLRLRESGVLLFPEFADRAVTPRATGKPSIEIPTEDLPHLLTSESATIDHIIFLNRNSEKHAGLYSFSKDVACSYFSQSLFSTTKSHATHTSALQHLLEVDIYELCYTDLDWAVQRLHELAVTGS